MAHLSHEQERFQRRYQELSEGGSLPCLGKLLQRTARKYPNNTALIYETGSLTYAQLYYYATQLSKKLVQKGIKPRDRVILMYENAPEFYIAYYGVLQIGAVIVPLNTFLQKQEVVHVLNDAEPTLIVTSTALLPVLEEQAIERSIPVFTEHDIQSKEPVPAVLTHFDVYDMPLDEMTALLYTSGTTGTPKGVMLSSKNILTNVLQCVSKLEPSVNDKVFAVLPLFHSFAQNSCVWSPIFIGCSIILVSKVERRAILNGLTKKPTVVLGVPALYGLFCLLRTAPLDYVRIFISGGDALPDRIRSAFALIYRRKICNGYGLSEASPLIAADIEDDLTHTATIGTPVVGVTCVIKDDEGKLLPPGTIGQLWAKGDNIMLGYYKADEMTNSVIVNGWLSTGDLAYIDAKGRIVITGRYKDLIKSKGFNIYPQEVENIIIMHPDVLRVGVIGKVDVEQGEIPIAYVQLKQENPKAAEELKNLCTKNLASYKIPRQFICSTEPLPMTATSKVDKKVLRKQLHNHA